MMKTLRLSAQSLRYLARMLAMKRIVGEEEWQISIDEGKFVRVDMVDDDNTQQKADEPSEER